MGQRPPLRVLRWSAWPSVGWLVMGLVVLAGSSSCIVHDTSVVVQVDGYRWCVELNGPSGHPTDSDPEAWSLPILEPDSNGDPRGCKCFDGEDNERLELGTQADLSGDPPPPGYAALRDALHQRARLRCTELASEVTPPLAYNSCLVPSTPLGIAQKAGMSSDCTLCQQGDVQSGEIEEIPCDGGGTGGTGGTSGGGTGGEVDGGSADESGTSMGFDCGGWDPAAAVTRDGSVSHVHRPLVEAMLAEHFAGLLACDHARYGPDAGGRFVLREVMPEDFVAQLGLRSGDRDLELRALDPAKGSGITPWWSLTTPASMLEAIDALEAHHDLELRVFRDAAGGERRLSIHLMDCANPNGIACPRP